MFIIIGFDKELFEFKELCSVLKKKCGCGGVVKEGMIEV